MGNDINKVASEELEVALKAEQEAHQATKDQAAEMEKTLNSAITAEQEAHQATKESNGKLIADLEDKLGQVKKSKATKLPSFKYDGSDYEVTMHAIEMDGIVVTAEDVKASAELQKQLIDMGSGMLVKKGK